MMKYIGLKEGRVETLIVIDQEDKDGIVLLPEDVDVLDCDYYFPLDNDNIKTLVKWIKEIK